MFFWVLFHLLPFWFQIFCFELQHDQMWAEIRSCKGLRLPTEEIADIFVTLMLKWIRYFHLQMHARNVVIFDLFFLNNIKLWLTHLCVFWVLFHYCLLPFWVSIFFFEFLDDVKQWMKQTWVWEMIFEVRWERENRYECLKSSCEENGFAGDDDGLIVPQL